MPASLPIVDQPRPPSGAAGHGRPGAELPTVRALSALWTEVSRRPLWAPPNFCRYVRMRWRQKVHRPEPTAVPHRGPRGKINDCAACTDICCVGKAATVLLRLKDIAMLIDIGRADLIAAAKPRFGADALASRPALARQTAAPSWQIFPVLRQDSMHACTALSREGKCTLYPHWPLACARFPYSLRQEANETFYSRRCQSFWIHPAAAPRGAEMAAAAVLAYNERITDLILLAYALPQLQALGVAGHLDLAALP